MTREKSPMAHEKERRDFANEQRASEWEISIGTDGAAIYQSDSGTIAMIPDDLCAWKENAVLIAAAPALLAALKAVADRLSAWRDGENLAQISAEMRNDRHAAEGHYNGAKNYGAQLETIQAAVALAEGRAHD